LKWDEKLRYRARSHENERQIRRGGNERDNRLARQQRQPAPGNFELLPEPRHGREHLRTACGQRRQIRRTAALRRAHYHANRNTHTRVHDIRSPVVAGVAGPARVTALLKYATICGVGPSLRTLSARAGVLTQLATERGPETVIRAPVRAASTGAIDLAGVHFFSFGGLTRTCAWIDAAARGQIQLADDGFDVIQPNRSR